MQPSLTHQLADLLLAIEAEMRRIDLWGAASPSEAALRSTTPFCHDTLAFHQWLQWVFLPRMKTVLGEDAGWPARSDIFPLAAEALRECEADPSELLLLIKQLDNFINRSAG